MKIYNSIAGRRKPRFMEPSVKTVDGARNKPRPGTNQAAVVDKAEGNKSAVNGDQAANVLNAWGIDYEMEVTSNSDKGVTPPQEPRCRFSSSTPSSASVGLLGIA